MHAFKLYALPLISSASEDANAKYIARAIRAMEENRIIDARSHVKQLSSNTLLYRMWKCLLDGCVLLMEDDLDRARECFEQCIQQTAGLHDPTVISVRTQPNAQPAIDVDLLRAAASEKLGFIHRRQERLEDAKRSHMETYAIRRQCDSPDGCWESAMSLGVDAVVARTFEEAREWFNQAAEHAANSSLPAIFTAIALEHLANVLIELHQVENAVESATRALDLRHTHDPGSIETALCEKTLGLAQLRLAQARIEQGEPAGSALEAALKWLQSAKEELDAFGPEFLAETQACAEQIDFAMRLLLSESPQPSATRGQLL